MLRRALWRRADYLGSKDGRRPLRGRARCLTFRKPCGSRSVSRQIITRPAPLAGRERQTIESKRDALRQTPFALARAAGRGGLLGARVERGTGPPGVSLETSSGSPLYHRGGYRQGYRVACENSRGIRAGGYLGSDSGYLGSDSERRIVVCFT